MIFSRVSSIQGGHKKLAIAVRVINKRYYSLQMQLYRLFRQIWVEQNRKYCILGLLDKLSIEGSREMEMLDLFSIWVSELCLAALEPAVDEYGQLQRRLQVERDCRSEAEKYACKVGFFINQFTN